MSVLDGRHILVIENHPLTALDLHEVIEENGGQSYLATSPIAACSMMGRFLWSLALIDQVLLPGVAQGLCATFRERAIPYFVFSAYCAVTREIQFTPRFSTPQRSGVLDTITQVIAFPDSPHSIAIRAFAD